MTDEEYMDRSRGAHQRLKILRDQVDDHLERASASVSMEALAPLIERMGKICDELNDLDQQRWGSSTT